MADSDNKFLSLTGLTYFKEKNDAHYIGEVKVNNTALTPTSRKNGGSVNISVPVQGAVSTASTTGYVSGAQVQEAIDNAIGGGGTVVHDAFKTFAVKQGSTTTNIVADGTEDTMTIEGGSRVTLTADASSQKLTISAAAPTLTDLGITATASSINTTAGSGITSAKVADYDAHIADTTSNPHNISKTTIGLDNVTNDKQVKGLSSGTTAGHIVTWGSDGYTVADSGKTTADFATAAQGSAIDSHISNTSNPHSVTKAQVGLGSVTNDKQIKGLSSGTTAGHFVTWGADGYTVADSGLTSSSFATAEQGTKADNAMPKSGGTFTGAVTLNGAPTADLHAATKKYVDDTVASLPEPMVFKGTLGTGGTITALPTASASNEGFVYKVITAGTYASQAAKVGDMFVCAKPEGASSYSWIYVPSGDEPSGTVTNIATGTGLTGGPITSSGTISLATSGKGAGTAGTTSAQSVNPGSAFTIPYVTIDEYGRVSNYGTSNVTVGNPVAITTSEIDALFATA